jgi:hypothetical protein
MEYFEYKMRKLDEEMKNEGVLFDLTEKIKELITESAEIEKMMIELVNSVIIKQELPSYDPSDDYFDASSRDFYRINSPDLKIEMLQRKLFQQYSRWYIEAEIIIKNYFLDHLQEFKNCKNGGLTLSDFGIVNVLMFNVIYTEKPTKKEILRQLLFKFDGQRSILLGICKVAHLISLKRHGNVDQNPESKPPMSITLGNHSKLNIQSPDYSQQISTNYSAFFNELRTAITENISDEIKRQELIVNVNDMESKQGTNAFIELYQKFMASAANHMTVIGPFLPVLSKLLIP